MSQFEVVPSARLQRKNRKFKVRNQVGRALVRILLSRELRSGLAEEVDDGRDPEMETETIQRLYGEMNC